MKQHCSPVGDGSIPHCKAGAGRGPGQACSILCVHWEAVHALPVTSGRECHEVLEIAPLQQGFGSATAQCLTCCGVTKMRRPGGHEHAQCPVLRWSLG